MVHPVYTNRCPLVDARRGKVCLFCTYRRWGDKTSYLKNVKCSGEPKKHGCFNTIMNGTTFYHATVALSFQIEICNLDRTKSSFLPKSLCKKVIFTKN